MNNYELLNATAIFLTVMGVIVTLPLIMLIGAVAAPFVLLHWLFKREE